MNVKFMIICIILFVSFQLVFAYIPIYLQCEYDKDIPLIIEGIVAEDLLIDSGGRILSQKETFTTITISLEDLPKLLVNKDLVITPAATDKPLLDQSTSEMMNGEFFAGCNADAAQIAGIDGSGVLIGILDYYPLNWKHEDFNTSGWASDDLRILYIWNQQDDSGEHPSGYNFGSEYSKADLMADQGPVIESGSHGTGCAGISAGDGSASGTGSPKKGIASGADIIYVHKIWDATGTINAINYFQDKADELQRPIVISFSGGTKFGFPDGSDLVSQVFDNFCQSGRLISVAAGNYYTTTDHALGNTTFETESNDVSLTIDSYTNSGSGQFDDLLDMAVFHKEGDIFDVTITDPDLNIYHSTGMNDEIFETIFGKLYVFYYESGSLEVVLTDEIGTVSAGDEWIVSLSVSDPEFDDEQGNWSAWLYEKNITAHFSTYNTSDMTLNIYATGQDCISVAAHSKTIGSIQSYSSAGLTYDNRQKPELSAPTNAYTANNSAPNTYSALGGTSGAAPHVAGTLALMLQRFPLLTPASARQQLIENIYQDAQTVALGNEPNKRYGYGKLNSFRATFPQLAAPENIQIVFQNDNSQIKISWDNQGFLYKVYSSANPTAFFPSTEWRLEASVDDQGELILDHSFLKQRFFLITVD